MNEDSEFSYTITRDIWV